MENVRYDKKKNLLINLIIFLAIIILAKEVKNIFAIIINILFPFILAFSTAYILNPLIKKMEKFHLKRNIAIVLIFIFISIIVASLIIFMLPKLISELKAVSNSIATYSINIEKFLSKTIGQIEYFNNNFTNIIQEIFDKLILFILKIFEKILTTLPMLFILPILVLYFLIDYEKIVSFIKKILIKQSQILEEINNQFRLYLNGVILVMIIMICLSVSLLSIFRIPNAFLLGTIIGITDIIPFIGPWIGGILVVIFGFGKSTRCGIISIILVVIIQTIENNFLVPKIQSQNIKTHPILIILSISIFSKIFGLIGVIFAIPLLAVIQIFLKNSVKMPLN